MATASIPRTSSTRKRKPSPDHVIATYHREAARAGERGAYRRTGDLLGISDETVRRYVAARKAAELEAQAISDVDLVYVPPPGGYPEPEPAAARQNEPHTAPQLTPAESGNITSNARSTVSNLPQNDDATRHSPERDSVVTDDQATPLAPLPADPKPERVRTFDEPAPLNPAPPEHPPTPYPVDPLDPLRPATVDPTETRTPGRMDVSPTVASFLQTRTVEPIGPLPSRETRPGVLGLLESVVQPGPWLAVLVFVLLLALVW